MGKPSSLLPRLKPCTIDAFNKIGESNTFSVSLYKCSHDDDDDDDDDDDVDDDDDDDAVVDDDDDDDVIVDYYLVRM